MSPEYPRNSGPYRSRNGIIFGVCRGIADHFQVSVFWVRIILVIVALGTWFGPAILFYLVAGLIMKPEPVLPIDNIDEAEFYNSYANSSVMALHRLKHSFDQLNRRIQRMESIVTNREYQWDKRFRDPE